LAALQAFHRLAWNAPLESDLKVLLSDPRTLLHRCPDPTLPEPQSMPAPRLEHIGVPDRLSATGYQQLMNCPYQFYVARCLQLTAPEEIQLALSKGDYGERIHTCLQAFHSNVEHLPGPFDQPFNAENRAAAIDLLMHIADEVFKYDLNDHFEHLGWLRQWQQVIPAYVDWQIQRSGDWQPLEAEVKKERALSQSVRLNGRIDRIDRGAHGLAILDYKTGAIPSKEDVRNGEKVQLPFYTLLTEEPSRVERVAFVRIDSRKVVDDNRHLSGDDLDNARQAHHERVLTLHQQLHEGSALPAWGDSDTCQRCDMKRVCRNGSWLEADSETTA
jgi:ATP-dependent helicase/nuclease subunit B